MKTLIFFILFSANAHADFQCHKYNSAHLKKEVRYCLERTNPQADQANERVVYFMHGMYGSADSWAGYSAQLKKLMEKEKFPNTTFVAFDTDGESFFSDHGGVSTGEKSYETWFTSEFMGFIEKTYGVCRERSCRALMGLSMGGFGALKMALKYPDRFSAAAVNCPALPAITLHGHDAEWTSYFGRHPVGNFFGSSLLKKVRAMFPTDEIFTANDPIALVEKFENPDLFPAIYFDVGGKDTFGFQEGAEKFKAALDKKGVKYGYYFDPAASHDIYSTRGIDALEFLRQQLQADSPLVAVNSEESLE